MCEINAVGTRDEFKEMALPVRVLEHVQVKETMESKTVREKGKGKDKQPSCR